MSYPPGPQNPYGQPQQPQQPQQPPQQQPQYGYPPQQQPQQSPYGYGAGGYPSYPGQPGYPVGMEQQMPGMVKAARVILFVLAGLQIIVGLFMLLGGAAVSNDGTDSGTGGALIAIALFVLVLAAIGIVLGVRFSKGAGGVRVGTIVYACLMILGGIGDITRGAGVGVVSAIIAFAIGGFLLAAMLQSDSSAWFNRQR